MSSKQTLTCIQFLNVHPWFLRARGEFVFVGTLDVPGLSKKPVTVMLCIASIEHRENGFGESKTSGNALAKCCDILGSWSQYEK
jgi:hypothetical protein